MNKVKITSKQNQFTENTDDKETKTICNKYFSKIKEYEKTNIYVIFYMDGCPFSKGALEFFEKNKMSYKAYQITRMPHDKLPKLLNCLAESSAETGFKQSHKTLPIIFYQGEFVGGFSDLKKMLD